jgi:hypothetical protein
VLLIGVASAACYGTSGGDLATVPATIAVGTAVALMIDWISHGRHRGASPLPAFIAVMVATLVVLAVVALVAQEDPRPVPDGAGTRR